MYKEVIVVEGKDDEAAVKRAVQAEVITTNGLGLSRETLELIATAQIRCGVIVFTDPDYPGEKIRRIIDQAVPGCRHAFLDQSKDGGADPKRIGVEYADAREIRAALARAKITQKTTEARFTVEDLCRHKLIGHASAAKLRGKVGCLLGIGRANGKQFLNRLNAFEISQKEFQAALEAALKGE